MERAANIWAALFGALAFGFLCCAGFGMAFSPDASTSPNEFPARFLIFAILATLAAAPGYVASVFFLIFKKPH